MDMLDEVRQLGASGGVGGDAGPPLLQGGSSGAALSRAAGPGPTSAPPIGPEVRLDAEDDEVGGTEVASVLQGLGIGTAAAEVEVGPVPSSLPTAFVAAGVAAGIGMGVLVGGPLGALVAGMAGAMGLVRGLVSLQSENQRLKEEVERLREQATTDALTGLPNRRELFDRLEREARRSTVGGSTVGIVLIDIDHFKRVNDTHGHPAGDEVLRVVAERLRMNLRPGDTVGRYGGEEFLVVMPDTELAAASEAAERLRIAVASTPVPLPWTPLDVTISLGVTVAKAAGLDTAIARADAALYRAKSAGRNRTEASD